MTHIRIKIAVAGLVLAASVTYLIGAGIRSGWVYYLDVDPFITQTRYHDQRIRLCGTVGPDHLIISSAALTAQFDLLGKTRSVPVAYHGVIPDTFKPGVDVVVEGKLDDQGVFNANVMMTKCASKYQEAGKAGGEHPKSIALPTEDQS